MLLIDPLDHFLVLPVDPFDLTVSFFMHGERIVMERKINFPLFISDYLIKQMLIINLKLIVVLGTFVVPSRIFGSL